MKNILKFIIILLMWLLGGLIFKVDLNYYKTLTLPSFTLPNTIISITWFILYILISISIYKVDETNKIISNNDYFYVLITNYLANELFIYGFFTLKSPFFGFVLTVITLVSSIFLYIETKKLSKKASYFLIPYIIFNIYAFLLSLSLYIINF